MTEADRCFTAACQASAAGCGLSVSSEGEGGGCEGLSEGFRVAQPGSSGRGVSMALGEGLPHGASSARPPVGQERCRKSPRTLADREGQPGDSPPAGGTEMTNPVRVTWPGGDRSARLAVASAGPVPRGSRGRASVRFEMSHYDSQAFADPNVKAAAWKQVRVQC